MTTDVILGKNKGYYDINWTADGDISTDQTLDTAILMSILEEVRASSTEIPESNKRRGAIINETTPGFEQGSKTWEFEQERLTGSVLAELNVVIRNSLQWMIDEGIAVNVEVDTLFLQNGVVVAPVNFSRDGSKVERRFFELWDNTGNF